jgi:leader peptidase (prepilin peptidase)/N-methyltransferase
MTTPPAAARTPGLLHIVRSTGPAQAGVTLALLLLALAAVGLAPAVVTALWLALATPSLVLIDVRLHRLPNVLVVPGLVAVLVDGVWAAVASAASPLSALVTTAVVAAAMLALNLAGGLGMGDVKLGAVITGCLSVIDPSLAVVAVMLAFFVGGACSVLLLVRHRGQRGRRMAFGPVLLFAFWAVLALRALSMTWVVSLS